MDQKPIFINNDDLNECTQTYAAHVCDDKKSYVYQFSKNGD